MFDASCGASSAHRCAEPQALPTPPGALIELACFICDTHNAATTSLDAHVEACLATRGGGSASASGAGVSGASSSGACSSGSGAARRRGLDADARVFVSQVAYGLHRYRKLLGAFLDGFFHVNS